MVAALGVNQDMLFTGVFALGAVLAGLGGALQIAARAPPTSTWTCRSSSTLSWSS